MQYVNMNINICDFLFVSQPELYIHLEITYDLSTKVFMLCLKRFIFRRGKCTVIHCDSRRNFVGANNKLAKFLQLCNKSISSFASDVDITFKFSPAYSKNYFKKKTEKLRI